MSPPTTSDVTIDRGHLAELVALARRAVRDDHDLDVVQRAHRIACTEGGRS